MVRHDGRITTVARAIFTVILDMDLHSSWQVKHQCPDATCVRLGHLSIGQTYNTRGLPVLALPDRANSLRGEPISNDDEDLIAMILDVGGARADPTALAAKRFWDSYSVQDILLAQATIIRLNL